MSDTLIKGFYHEGEKIADTKAPLDVPIAQCWEQRKFSAALVNPANRRKLRVIIVGTGLAGGAAAAAQGEPGGGDEGEGGGDLAGHVFLRWCWARSRPGTAGSRAEHWASGAPGAPRERSSGRIIRSGSPR